MTYCYLRVPIGDFDDAVGHLNESAQIGLDLGLEEPRLFGLTHTANTLTYMTRFEEAWEVTQEARQLAETVGNRKWLAENLALPSTLHHMRNGDLDAASETAEAGEELATQIGAAEQEAYGAMMLGQIRWLRGDYEGAIACQHRARQAGSTAGLPYIEAAALCSLGTAYMDISNVFIDQTDEFHSKAMLLMDMPLGSVMGDGVERVGLLRPGNRRCGRRQCVVPKGPHRSNGHEVPGAPTAAHRVRVCGTGAK